MRQVYVNEFGERIVSDPWNPTPEEIAEQRERIKADNGGELRTETHQDIVQRRKRQRRQRQRKQ